MAILKIIILLGGGIGFLYGLLKKPDIIAILLFTLVTADVNFDVPGLPLNFRATVTLLLFARIFGEESTAPKFFSNSLVWHLVIFLVWISLVSQFNGLLSGELLKEFVLSCLSAYLGYYYFFKKNDYSHLKIAMIIGGLICLADLAYTYAFYGGFPVVRIHQVYTGQFSYNNHNFFGYICGTCFVFLLSDYLTNRKSASAKLSLLMMPCMFLGVLLSTSRGALLAMILVAVILIAKALTSAAKSKKAATLVSMTVICVILSLFIFQIAGSLGIQNDFMQTITGRLIDEPIAMLNKAMGNSYNTNSMDSMEWREEASSLAYDYYMSLPPAEQMLGIGYGGFLARDVGSGYDAHNGLLLLVTETGVIGFIIYFSLIFSFWSKTRSLKLASPAFISIIFILLYITSHNKENTSFFAFLIMGSLIGQIRYYSTEHEAVEEEEQVTSFAGN
ncbi:MAG: O-antigen ligase family protein [Chitinophagaceae bacterium]|nr:O-antigen ligase family protein [Chitinophagaceae bacterium]